MGMRIHFNKADLPENTGVDYILDEESGTWSAVIRFQEGVMVVNVSPDKTEAKNHSFWFDCGRATDLQMEKIKKLILNRVCFSTS